MTLLPNLNRNEKHFSKLFSPHGIQYFDYTNLPVDAVLNYVYSGDLMTMETVTERQ